MLKQYYRNNIITMHTALFTLLLMTIALPFTYFDEDARILPVIIGMGLIVFMYALARKGRTDAEEMIKLHHPEVFVKIKWRIW